MFDPESSSSILSSEKLALVAGMSVGAASEAVRRTTGGGGQGSLFMSEANVKRLVGKLSQMRGAALKLGQFMSIQGNCVSSRLVVKLHVLSSLLFYIDSNTLPEPLEKVMQQVQANADYMPDWQLEVSIHIS
jgi:aarF domain-containing kinase